MTESLVGNARNGDFIYAASDENSVWVEVRLADNKMSTTIARQIAELLYMAAKQAESMGIQRKLVVSEEERKALLEAMENFDGAAETHKLFTSIKRKGMSDYYMKIADHALKMFDKGKSGYTVDECIDDGFAAVDPPPELEPFSNVPYLEHEKEAVLAIMAKTECLCCGGDPSHQTNPLFGDGPPHFTCKTDEDMVGSQHEY